MNDFNWIVSINPIAKSIHYLFANSTLLQNLANYFENILCKNISKQNRNLFFTIGIIAITYKILHFIHTYYNMWKWIPSHIKNQKRVKPQQLKQKYGDCYVVVTGCTQGIGLSFVIELVKMDFGVVLVARNQQKLRKRIEEVKAICPNLRYEKVIGDLSKIADLKRITKQLQELSKRIDIGIVINNAGSVGSKFKKFFEQDPKLLQNILAVNFTSAYKINAAMIPIFRARKNYRSAILNLSSGLGYFISHGNGTYTASKIMQDIYSRTLSNQNRDKIDIISVRPFGVRTAMMSMAKGPFMISPKTCVISSLADLGTNDATWSGFMHKVQASFMGRMTEKEVFVALDALFDKFK